MSGKLKLNTLSLKGKSKVTNSSKVGTYTTIYLGVMGNRNHFWFDLRSRPLGEKCDLFSGTPCTFGTMKFELRSTMILRNDTPHDHICMYGS